LILNIDFKNFLIRAVCILPIAMSIEACRSSHFEDRSTDATERAFFSATLVKSSATQMLNTPKNIYEVEATLELKSLRDSTVLKNQPVKIRFDHPALEDEKTISAASDSAGQLALKFKFANANRNIESVYTLILEIDTRDFGQNRYSVLLGLNRTTDCLSNFQLATEETKASTSEKAFQFGMDVLSVSKRIDFNSGSTEFPADLDIRMKVQNKDSPKTVADTPVRVILNDGDPIDLKTNSDGVISFRHHLIYLPYEAEQNFHVKISFELPTLPTPPLESFYLIVNLENDPQGAFVEYRKTDSLGADFRPFPPGAEEPPIFYLTDLSWNSREAAILTGNLRLTRATFKGLTTKIIPNARIRGKSFALTNADPKEILIDLYSDVNGRWQWTLPAEAVDTKSIAFALDLPGFPKASRLYFLLRMESLEAAVLSENEIIQMIGSETPLANLYELSPGF